MIYAMFSYRPQPPAEPPKNRDEDEPVAPVSAETERIRRWRAGELLRGGYSVEAACTLAASEVDLHKAYDLLQRGCSEETALRILL